MRKAIKVGNIIGRHVKILPDRLKSSFDRDVVGQLGDVHLAPGIWWHLAVEFPGHARLSPLFDLMVLEDPGQWADIEGHTASVIHAYLEYLEEKHHGQCDEWSFDLKERMLALIPQSDPDHAEAVQYLHLLREFLDLRQRPAGPMTEHEAYVHSLSPEELRTYVETLKKQRGPRPKRTQLVAQAPSKEDDHFMAIQETMRRMRKKLDRAKRDAKKPIAEQKGYEPKDWALAAILNLSPLGTSNASFEAVDPENFDGKSRSYVWHRDRKRSAERVAEMCWQWERLLFHYCKSYIMQDLGLTATPS